MEQADEKTGLSLRERQRQTREEAIIEAAHELIAAQGYDAMTMDDLAARAGISKPTLYQHFPSKEAIIIRAVVTMAEQSADYMETLSSTVPALERMEQLMSWMMTKKYGSCRTAFGSARAALTPVIRSNPDYQRVHRRMLNQLLELITAGKAEGMIDPALSTRVLAQMFFSLLRDSEYEELIARGECTVEEISTTLTAVIRRGVQRGGGADRQL